MADLAVDEYFPEEQGDPLPPWRAPEARKDRETSSELGLIHDPVAARAPKKPSHNSSTDSMFPDSEDEMLFDGH
jgi:hypothetical protein